MFGFMKNRACASDVAAKNQYRLQYCGTCKAMGALYGQGTRPFLNFDTVFLSELLTVLSESTTQHWDKSLHSYNCFSLPDKENIPLPLQFSASVNVILAGLKTEDNIQDSRFPIWNGLKWLYNPAFRKAKEAMKAWGLDTSEIENLPLVQWKLEHSPAQNAQIKDFAHPTAQITASIFAKGAEVLGKSECKEVMERLGYQFGELMYVLDAYQDFEKDGKTKQFNAVRYILQDKSALLEGKNKETMLAELYKTETKIQQTLALLPISASAIRLFSTRFSLNLHAAIATEKSANWEFEKNVFQRFWEERKAKATNFAQNMLGKQEKATLQYRSLIWAAMMSPRLPQYFEQHTDNTRHSLTFLGILLGILATWGIGKKIKKTCQSAACNSGGKVDSYQIATQLQKDVCGDCCAGCAQECCSECCESCCQSCCQSACDNMCTSMGNGEAWGWIVLGSIVLLIGIVALIVLYVA